MEHAAQHGHSKGRAKHKNTEAPEPEGSATVRWGDPEKAPQELSPQAEDLCEQFFQENVAFATRFAELAGINEELAPALQGRILARCSETITEARLSALEAIKP